MTSDMLSQEEIDALLKGGSDDSFEEDTNEESELIGLSDIEVDTLGEIGNISMGTAATTLFTLLGQKVLITTPQVSVTTIKKLAEEYPKPFVAVDVKYKVGIDGTNLLILRAEDVKIITDLMLGGDGTNIQNTELTEMDMSAISEAMNQMVGSSSTSLSEMLQKKIDIDPPRAFEMTFGEDADQLRLLNVDINEEIVKISFRMVVGDVIDSQIMQLVPLSFAQTLVDTLLNSGSQSPEPEPAYQEPVHQEPAPAYAQPQPQPTYQEPAHQQPPMQQHISSSQMEPNYGYQQPQRSQVDQRPVNVKPYEFEAFDKNDKMVYNESIEMIQDIPIEITVELGRTKRKISEILEYGPGTIIELDKLVGESLEIYANGKIFAKGEVVVIDDNFGVRITDILNTNKKVRKI